MLVRRRRLVVVAAAAIVDCVAARRPAAQPQTGGWPASLLHDLDITSPAASATERLDLGEALHRLHVPSVSIAIIDDGRLGWAGAYGHASTRTLYQAASMSKLVTAVAALRLVAQGRLGLDRDVNTDLISWHVPDSDLTRGHPVTLRGLLSMTGGIGVPGYVGYEPGSPLPSLAQILDGARPANSAPVRVERVPGSAYAYSGGGYEIVQALIEDATHQPFADAMQDLVLRPLGMSDSVFAQPPPRALVGRVAAGHSASGAEVPGSWRVVPELAAGGLLSTPTDLARLLMMISQAYRGETNKLLDQTMAVAMLTPPGNGPYGLGGAVAGSDGNLVLMKRGQNVGYQGYLLVYPETGKGMVIMTGSDNGTSLATALIRRACVAFGWPPIGHLPD